MAVPPLYYLPGFSTAGSTQDMTIKSGAGTGTVAAGTYAYATFASVVSTYTAFGAAVVTALNSAAAGTYTVSLTTTLTSITFTIYSVAGFTLTFPSTDAGNRCKVALGFSTIPLVAGTAAAPYTSTIRPYYCIIPAMGARSDFTDVYEPADIVEEAVSDGGVSYGVARATNELWCDWSQTMETKAATLTRSATAAVPMTYQAMVKHCRSQHPIGVYETATSNNLYRLRADGASFVPERVAADYDGLWNIPFRTRDLGVLP